MAFVSDEGGSPYFMRFLRHGLAGCPSGMADRYAGLATWQGVGELKATLRTLAGHRPDLPVLLANRSAHLMRLAARLLFHPCRKVLVTDLGWPAYHRILEEEARRTGRHVVTVALRDAILSGALDEDGVVKRVAHSFAREGCDGLFLTAVSNLGVRLPAERITRLLEEYHRVRFVVIDGAQDFCHLPGRLAAEYCDLYLTGCHKWLSAHLPLGVAFYGRRRSRGVIDTLVQRLVGSGDLDDPLLRFTTQLEADRLDGVTETVNLLPLFTARGAATDAASGRVACRAENRSACERVATVAGWAPLSPHPSLRSAILLLEPTGAKTRETNPDALRDRLRDAGLVATTYDGGRVRLSMPGSALDSRQLDTLQRALRNAV
jgi:selenocysteine lyase/cysteine desulfurase